jgi:hypothetical protein
MKHPVSVLLALQDPWASTGLDPAGVCTFPHVVAISKTNSLCCVSAILILLDSLGE